MPTLEAKPRYQGKPMNNRELADNLCAVSSALTDARLLHVKHFGTLVPHVFMGDVLKRIGWCLEDAKRSRHVDHDSEVAAILDALERGMTIGDRETRNVISLSFSADCEVEAFFTRLRPLLGPKVLAGIPAR